MLIWFRNLRYRKEFCLFCAVTFCLLNIQSVSAWAPRTINFGAKKAASSQYISIAIAGEVKNPATYRISQEEITLEQLIQIAGGATPDAGRKVRVVRGGRSLLVLLRPSQDNFKLSAGDVVVLDRQWRSSASASASSFEYLPKSTADSRSVVIRANHQKNNGRRDHGQIVLVGLVHEPVVLPLWDEELTVVSLLTGWMKQPSRVAARTRIIFGQKRQSGSHRIAAGMVLMIPQELVQAESLPRLPSPVLARNNELPDTAELPDTTEQLAPASSQEATAEAFNDQEQEQKKQPETQSTPADEALDLTNPIPGRIMPSGSAPEGVASEEESPESSEDQNDSSSLTQLLLIPQDLVPEDPSSDQSVADLLKETSDDLMAPFLEVDQNLISKSESKEESVSENDELFPFAQPSDFTDLLEQNLDQNIHVAQAGEAVPDPVETKKTEAPTLIGFVAGAIVLIGVITVIISTIRNQFTQSAHHGEELEHAQKQLAGQAVEKQRKNRFNFSQQKMPDVQEAMSASSVSEKPAAQLSDPLTRAKQLDQSGLEALLENQIPIIEERVLMPRELKFFGKPNLHYEFRIDASHQMNKPHLTPEKSNKASEQKTTETAQTTGRPKHLAASKKSLKQSAPVYWEGEAGLFVSSHEVHQAITPSNR